MRTEIVYEDKDIIVAYKPAMLPTQSASVGQMDMESELRNYLAKKTGKKPYLAVIHRLDQPVEGLLVFGLTPSAAAKLNKELNTGSLKKSYRAMICGKPAKKTDNFVDYMKKDGNIAVVVSDESASVSRSSQGYKIARLHYDCFKTIQKDGQEISDVEIKIDTGRFHQIRAQMAYHGLPLLGDFKYGDKAGQISQACGIKTVALCAWKLSFMHPTTNKKMDFSIEPRNIAFFQSE